MKIDGGMPGNIAVFGNMNELAEKLNVGDVFRAKIIEITTNELFLKLFDGTQVKASIQTPINASAGDFMNFEVKSNDGNKLFLAPSKTKIDSPKASEFEKLLSNLGVTDSQSRNIAKALFDSNMKVTSDAINNINTLIKDFKSSNLTPAKAVFLLQNEVPVIKENVNLLNSFLNKEFNLSGKLEDITGRLSTLSDSKITEIANKLNLLESMEKLPNLLSKLVNIDDMLNKSANIGKTAVSQPLTTDNDMSQVTGNLIEESAPPSGSPISTNPGKSPLEKLDKLIENAVQLVKNNPDAILNADADDLEKLKELFTRANVSKPSTDANDEQQPVKDKNIRPHEILKKVFDNCFVKLDDKISPEDIDVKDIYKKILHRLSIIKEAAEGSQDTSVNELKSNITHFDKQINFLNDINNPNNTFVQVPLNYEGYKNGELYIIKKKKSNKNDNQDGTTMFLSLGTVNIGRFETLVNVKDKNIKLYMRLEDDNLIDFVKKNYNIIYELLDKTPYKIVDIKCKKIDDEINPLNLQATLNNEFIGDTKSIDYKI